MYVRNSGNCTRTKIGLKPAPVRIEAVSSALLPVLQAVFDKTPNTFDSYKDVLQLYEGGLPLPDIPQVQALIQAIPLEMLKNILTPPQGQHSFLKLPVPQIIQGWSESCHHRKAQGARNQNWTVLPTKRPYLPSEVCGRCGGDDDADIGNEGREVVIDDLRRDLTIHESKGAKILRLKKDLATKVREIAEVLEANTPPAANDVPRARDHISPDILETTSYDPPSATSCSSSCSTHNF
ncbi:putative linoleate 9S-lipoxygenase 5 [Platanthera guangdongensis]|uniref:Linoleate 9S-lipoxygenase 5 n=1 Tax=Platanthera guangdongensis TaxID=2320717 RepID=A0ABR2MJM0_9ASPA